MPGVRSRLPPSKPPAVRPPTILAKAPSVAPNDILGPAQVKQVDALRAKAASRVAALRDDLAELESALGGRLPLTKTAKATLQPRISLYRSLLGGVTSVPGVSADQGSPAILANMSKYGLRDRSFDTVVPVTAPNKIDQYGNSYDAGAVYDAWILNPSVDTKFDFNQPPSQNTPFISANSRMQFQVKKQKVFYLAQNPGAVGVLQIWLLKFAT